MKSTKRQLKVLFLYPNLYMMNMMPPAIAVLSALLKRKGFEVGLFDTTYYRWDGAQVQMGGQGVGRFEASSDKRKEESLQVRPFDLADRGIRPRETDLVHDWIECVDSFHPDLIAMSAVEDTFPQGLFLLEATKDRRIPAVVGGVFATFAPHLVLRHDPIDFVCVGEGEGALVDLCEHLATGRDPSSIANLWVKAPDGQVKKNPQRPVIDLDDLPMPDFEIFEENRIYRPMAGKVYRMIPIETHRGCPYTCTYCNSPAQIQLHVQNKAGRFFRKRSMEKVREELAYLVERWKAEYVYFPADTFLAWTPDELKRFAEMYAEFKLPFWCQTRPETITEDNVALLKSVGLHRMSLGIEHGNEKFRREVVHRPISNRELIEKTNIAGRCVPVSVNNITGFPGETRDLAFDTIRMNRELEVDTMNCYGFVPYHGTPLRDVALKMGFLSEDSVTRPLVFGSILEMPQYPRHEISAIIRTFSLYARLPESEYPRIRRAEMDDEEGAAIFSELRREYIERYFNDGKVTFS